MSLSPKGNARQVRVADCFAVGQIRRTALHASGAPSHFALPVLVRLDSRFTGRWISR